MERNITRDKLGGILRQWQDGILTAEQVHEWASEMYCSDAEYDDWEDDEQNSVALEVLAALDMLDMNLVLPSDIPVYLDFLDTPMGQFSPGYRRWNDALGHIDYAARQKLLKTQPLYAPFCK